MSKFRLALVRQKYRPDGGAERFVSRALEALDSSHLQLNVITREWQGPVKPDWQIHICNPRKWGRISRERGFANAARALWQRESFDLVQSHERIPGCDLYRAGDGVHRRWLQRYQALAKSLNCEARVRFFGMQSETLPFYQMADGLLLPTLYDPFPNVILEAMACGLPVITTTGCGGAEFIVDGHNGYVCDALDIPALQQAVMALPARALGSAEGGHARERIMACTSERLSTQLLSLYQDLVK